MNNLILHLISNRPGPFATALFGQEPTFVPQIIPAAEQTLRALLCLDKTNTDYYLKVYLAVLNAYSDWKQQFGLNLQESYAVEELMPRGVYIQGADLLGTPDGAGLFVEPAVNHFPVELHYRITYRADNLCQITGMETSVQYSATVISVGSNPTKIIRITWPDAVPFIGPMRLSQPWVLGAVVDIFVQPSNFPFSQLIESVRGNAYLQNLFMLYGIAAEFNEDKDVMEQTAMILTALGLTNQTRLLTGLSSQQTTINSNTAGWLATGLRA